MLRSPDSELCVDTSERFMGGPEKYRAYTVTYPTDCAHLEWREWNRPSPTRSSLQMATKEAHRAMGESTSGLTVAGTPLAVFQGQWSIARYAPEMQDMA